VRQAEVPPTKALTLKLLVPEGAVDEIVRVRVVEGKGLPPFALTVVGEKLEVTPAGSPVVQKRTVVVPF
jgi:hypothetical protein